MFCRLYNFCLRGASYVEDSLREIVGSVGVLGLTLSPRVVVSHTLSRRAAHKSISTLSTVISGKYEILSLHLMKGCAYNSRRGVSAVAHASDTHGGELVWKVKYPRLYLPHMILSPGATYRYVAGRATLT